MARILISYFSDYGEAMYDAICGVLHENCNDIFRLNINNSSITITKWGGESKINDIALLSKIRDFNPEIILNFNNCLPKNLYKILDKNCKICAVDADAPSVAFWNKDICNKYFDRFVFLGLQSYSKAMYENWLNIKLTNKNYIYFPPATIVKNENLKQNKNISFIGSNFYPLEVPGRGEVFSQDAIKLYNAFEKNYFLTLKEAEKICKHTSDVEWLYEYIRWIYAGQDRLRYMQQLTDLGFEFFGMRYWQKIAYYDFEIARCFNPIPKVTLQDNQWVYNTSKIAVNFSHPLAKSSFSWRVMDIMASNACLLMEDKPDWRDLFEKYLSPEVLEIIIYKDRFDMRQKAIKLLNDEKLRKKCVSELNNAIEKNGRWEVRFKSLEAFLGIKILNVQNNNLKYLIVSRQENKPVKKQDNAQVTPTEVIHETHKPFLHSLRLANRFKMAHYALITFFVQIPVLDLLFRSRKRVKLLNKIQKWWR